MLQTWSTLGLAIGRARDAQIEITRTSIAAPKKGVCAVTIYISMAAS